MSNKDVADYLAKNFRCAWKRIGSFTVVKSGDKVVRKIGGNVAAYFCTPEGKVLGAVLGASEPIYFLNEAKAAVALSSKVTPLSSKQAASLAKQVHEGRGSDSLLATHRSRRVWN